MFEDTRERPVETGWFWLSSRYYSPELCRFISPDDIEYLDPENINGLNLYCYCLNNPIMYVDPTGHWVDTAFDVASLIYDIYCLSTNDGHKDWKNWLALGFDAVCLILPFISGGSTVYRVANRVDNIDDIHDAINSLEIAGDMSDIALVGRNADRVKAVGKFGYTYYDGLQCYKQLSSKGWYGKVAAEIAGKFQNAAWLTKQLWKGRTIVDIGMGARMAMSTSYLMEKTILFLYRRRRYIRWGVRIGLEF